MADQFRLDAGTDQPYEAVEPARAHGAENRRAYERVSFFCEVRLTALAQRLTVTAHTCDLSQGGAKLVSPIALRSGADVMIEFALAERGSSSAEQVYGRVMRCDADLDANYLGIEFSDRLSAVETPLLWRRLVRI